MTDYAYHRDLALAHFSSVLHEKCTRPPYQAIALLSFLWCCVDDPWEVNPIICVAHSRLAFIVPHRPRRAVVLKQLREIGALKSKGRTKGGVLFELKRPDVAVLSAELREQVEAATHPGDYRHCPAWRQEARELARSNEGDGQARRNSAKAAAQVRKEQAKTEREYMRKHAIQRSDIRDWLAYATHQTKTEMRYSGDGSRATTAALRWAMNSGHKPKHLRRLCKLMHADAQRPESAEFTFELDTDDKRRYLERLVEDLRAKDEAEQVVEEPATEAAPAAELPLWESDEVVMQWREQLLDLPDDQRRQKDPDNVTGSWGVSAEEQVQQ